MEFTITPCCPPCQGDICGSLPDKEGSGWDPVYKSSYAGYFTQPQTRYIFLAFHSTTRILDPLNPFELSNYIANTPKNKTQLHGKAGFNMVYR